MVSRKCFGLRAFRKGHPRQLDPRLAGRSGAVAKLSTFATGPRQLPPKPGRSVCTRKILKPAVRAIIRFPFFHVRQAISGKLNWEQILRERLVRRRRTHCRTTPFSLDLPFRERLNDRLVALLSTSAVALHLRH
jgi:hypothetical protein